MGYHLPSSPDKKNFYIYKSLRKIEKAGLSYVAQRMIATKPLLAASMSSSAGFFLGSVLSSSLFAVEGSQNPQFAEGIKLPGLPPLTSTGNASVI